MSKDAVGMDSRAFALAALAFLTAVGPARGRQPTEAPPDATASLGQVLDELQPGERVRVHPAGSEPVAADFLEASPESVLVSGDRRAARVANSRIERLDVANHPYRLAALIGSGVGAVVGGLGGAGLGALVGAGMTTWDQRYPPP